MATGEQGRRYSGHMLSTDSIDIVLWAINRRQPITRELIQARWPVSKSTAWRWVPWLEDARQRALNLNLPRAQDYRRPAASTDDQALHA